MQFSELSLIDGNRRYRHYGPLLWMLSLLYGIGIRLWSSFRPLWPSRALPGFVVSIGNLTVGGTGKTPAACLIAQWAKEKGYRVAILSRGYKGNYKQKVLVVSDGVKVLAAAEEAGDEPVLMARKLTGIPVIVARRRYDGGMWAYRHYATEFFILDDGFQHRVLGRDLDLVLLDGQHPFGNGCLLPRGPLREPVSALKRAQALVMTRCENGLSSESNSGMKVRRYGQPVFCSSHIPDKIIFPVHKKTYDLHFISGKRVIAFAGIGNPGAFREMLIQLGAEIIAFESFGDHHPYTEEEIKQFKDMQVEEKADFIISTEKDWMRMENIGDYFTEFAYLTISLTILDNQDEFFRMIEKKLFQYKGGLEK